jgi:hypothetical protein
VVNECNGDITSTCAACPETASYGHGIGADPTTISANGNVPVAGAVGFEGARALTENLGAVLLQSNTKGWVVNVYLKFCGGGAKSPIPDSDRQRTDRGRRRRKSPSRREQSFPRRRSRCAANPSGAASSSTLPCGAGGRSPRWRWLGNWRCICTGCGARATTTANCKSSVRMRESPDIPMVGSEPPT